jgi:hypothetical protein
MYRLLVLGDLMHSVSSSTIIARKMFVELKRKQSFLEDP